MDAYWFVEIAQIFCFDRHTRPRKSKPSVPQVPPPRSQSTTQSTTAM